MASTVDELAIDLGVTPGDIEVLMSQYGGDVPLWEEGGVPAGFSLYLLGVTHPETSAH